MPTARATGQNTPSHDPETHTDARADSALVLRQNDKRDRRQRDEHAAEEAEQDREDDDRGLRGYGDHTEDHDADDDRTGCDEVQRPSEVG